MAMLLKKIDDGTMKIHSFGQNAMIEYAKVLNRSIEQNIYLDRVKMNLKEDEMSPFY